MVSTCYGYGYTNFKITGQWSPKLDECVIHFYSILCYVLFFSHSFFIWCILYSLIFTWRVFFRWADVALIWRREGGVRIYVYLWTFSCHFLSFVRSFCSLVLSFCSFYMTFDICADIDETYPIHCCVLVFSLMVQYIWARLSEGRVEQASDILCASEYCVSVGWKSIRWYHS